MHTTFLANREIEQNEGSTTICIQYNLRDKQNFSMFSSLQYSAAVIGLQLCRKGVTVAILSSLFEFQPPSCAILP